jgi:hypothetical protein
LSYRRVTAPLRVTLFLLLPLLAIGGAIYATGTRGTSAGGATAIDARLIVHPRTTEQVASADGMRVRLRATPLVPGANQFTIDLSRQRHPLAHASVTLAASMSGMLMRPLQYVARSTGSGHYVAAGALTMFGRWRLVVTVARPGALPARITFPVSLDVPPALVSAVAGR